MFFLLSIFSRIHRFHALLVLQPLMRGRLGKIAGMVKVALFSEAFIEKTPFSFLLADRILAVCEN